MNLRDFWHILRRRWLIVLGVTALCLAASFAYARSLPVTYTASSSVYVSMATGTSVNDSYQGGLAAQQRVRSYVDLATSVTVAQRVKDQLGLAMSVDELRDKITATAPPATTLIFVSVTDSSAEGARVLADQVVSQFRRLVAELESIQRDAAPAARAEVVDKAQLPSAPSGPQQTRLLGLGLLAGLVLGGAAAVLRDRLDRRLRSSADVEAVVAVPVLGIVDDGRPGEAGELRRLRARLTRDDRDPAAIVLASLSPRSRPEVAIGLARSFADAGHSVLLLDADTTGRGSSTRLLPPETRRGLAELLRHRGPPGEAIVSWPDSGVDLLPLGEADARTPDLLASERFTEIMAKLGAEFDHIVVDAAPVTGAADAIALTRRAEAAVGVIELGTTTATQVRGALATLGDGGTGLDGVVVYSAAARRAPRLWKRRSNDR
ncbi:polysaccharide biosynthesis tyrosine autokinase [Nocardia cyriacigeorgica]|uniref:Protein tyrosine kinase n=1 Tax=Nocardia cyriacigeorgica TaxID=135487 RepID=A0A5R8NMA5_9NOCA|nr:polysaccharide biosynthesis tyrosine autokinase [Nocardia cyriacigeorgica]TLF76819.1 protein tyrosine kinase [Nocardia cyriacigeorgica]